MNLLLLGDICPTDTTIPYFKEKKVPQLFGDTLSLFKDRDYIIANLECALTEHDTGIEKYGPCLKAPAETAEVLRMVGVTHCGLANNHVFDFGIKGLTDTVKALENNSIGYTGIGQNETDARKNLFLEKDGETVAVVAVCEHEYSYALPDRMGSRGFDVFDTPDDIRAAKQKADRVIVMYHGGKEYCRYPSPRLRKACHAMVKAGADLILCQHSHCIGCAEEVDGATVLYGQGNFHFSNAHSPAGGKNPGWGTGMAVAYDTKTGAVTYSFCTNTNTGIAMADETKAKELKDGFLSRCDELKDGRWLDGWKAFCHDSCQYYIDCVRQALNAKPYDVYNLLGHYLDCEAHHDVLTNFFPTANAKNER